MNIYNINDQEFKNSSIYQDFIKDNPTSGYLKIRAYAASEALPISNMQVEISKTIGDNKIIFFSGITDNSGMIERVTLPTPRLDVSDLNIPNNIEYDIDEIGWYPKEKITLTGEELDQFKMALDKFENIDDVTNVYHNVDLGE